MPLPSNEVGVSPGNPIPEQQLLTGGKAVRWWPPGQTCSQKVCGRCVFLWAFLTVFVRKASEALPNPRAMEVAMPKDLQQEASLAKRRYTDVCRQGRIFDARNRIIGVRH